MFQSVNRLRTVLLVAVASGLLAAWAAGLFDLLGDPELLRSKLLAMGPWGYVVYLIAFAFLQPAGVPGVALIFASTYVWPKPVAYGLSLVGAMLGATLGFYFSRFIGRDWVSARLPERFRKYDERIASRGLSTAFFLRIVFWMNPFVHALFGISRVSFSRYAIGTLLGYVPSLAIAVWASGSVVELLRSQPPWRAGVAVVCIVALVLLRRVLVRKRKARQL